MIFPIYFIRRCDSRNLDVSSLCKLSSGEETVLWSDEVSRLYRSKPGYIESLKKNGSWRKLYPTQYMQESEILTTMTQASVVEYDAFENDIAMVEIYFGSPTAVG